MKKRYFLTTVMVIAMPLAALAVDQNPDTPILDEVVVSVSRVKEKKKEVSANIIVLDEQEIRLSSAKDLGELLAENGIGYIKKYPGATTSIGIRGFRTETHGNDLRGHVLVLLNGRRAGTGNVAKIMTDNVERIEIIRGPAAIQYGSAAMGGIVNVITKQGDEKPAVFFEAGLGGFGIREVKAGFSGKVEKVDFSGSFGKSAMDDYETAAGTKYYNTGYSEERNYSFNLGLEFLPGQRFGAILTGFNGEGIGNPSYLSANDLDDYADKKNSSLDLVYDGSSEDERLAWKIRYFTGEDDDLWADPVGSNPDGWDDGVPSTTGTDQQGAQAQVTARLGDWRLTTGLDWIKYEVEANWTPEETVYENPAGFLIGKTSLLDQRMTVTGGLRYDLYDVEVIRPAGRKESDSNLGLQLGATYLVNDMLKLRVNYGEAFVMPGADQLAANYVIWGTPYVGNPNLIPEESKTYEGGVDFNTGALQSAITYFRSDFKNKIEAVTVGGNRTWQNLGSAVIAGFEGDISYDLASLFDWDYEVKPYAGFVYLSEFRDEDNNQDLLDTADLVISYGIRISDFDGFSAALNCSYQGKQRIEDWETGGWPPPQVDVGGFQVVDLTFSKRIFTSEYGGITINGEARNLLDNDYAYVKGYPMPGRSFFVGLRYDY